MPQKRQEMPLRGALAAKDEVMPCVQRSDARANARHFHAMPPFAQLLRRRFHAVPRVKDLPCVCGKDYRARFASRRTQRAAALR